MWDVSFAEGVQIVVTTGMGFALIATVVTTTRWTRADVNKLDERFTALETKVTDTAKEIWKKVSADAERISAIEGKDGT